MYIHIQYSPFKMIELSIRCKSSLFASPIHFYDKGIFQTFRF